MINLQACFINSSSGGCRESLAELRQLMEFFYTIKYLPSIKPPQPGPGPFPREINDRFPEINIEHQVVGELFLDALRKENVSPQLSQFSLVEIVRKSGIHKEVLEDFKMKLDLASKAINQELEEIQRLT